MEGHITLDIAFYKGRERVFNRMVSWWTQGAYSHCELIEHYYPDGITAKCWSSSMMDGGVRSKPITLNNDHWDIVSINIPREDRDRAIQWFKDHEGQKYDLIGLIGFVIGSVKHSKTRWYCSEAISQALGLHESWRFHPNLLKAVLQYTQHILE